MKFGMISDCAEGAGILYRLMREGNDVKLFIKNRLYRNAWEGILSKTDNYKELLSDNRFILFDTVSFGNINELCKERHISSFGGSRFADRLESDRSFGTDFMLKYGISIPETKTFNNIYDAIIFAKTKDRLVFKPHGSHNKISCNLTYSAKDKEDMIEYLNFVEKHIKDIDKFDLQEFIDGVAISSEVLVIDGKPTEIYDHTIENKKFMNGNIGPSTGCEGNAVWFEPEVDRLISGGIGKVTDFEGFTGFIDLNCILTEDKVYGLEWTPRFGYDATPTMLMNLLRCDIAKVFLGEVKPQDFREEFATSVRFSIPPYPLEGKSPDYDNTGIPINIKNYDDENYYFYEIMLQDKELVHCSGIGNIGLGFGLSDDLDDSFEQSLENARRTKIPDVQYRTDLGEVIGKDFEKYLNWRN